MRPVPSSVLIANRGEIAIRIARACAELGIRSVAVFSEDDSRCLHVRKADQARPLRGRGAAAYLDAEQIVALARDAGCDAIHPGYGFLAENVAFAALCRERSITFVGPSPAILGLFGDKLRARELAAQSGVPVLRATDGAVDAAQAREFLAALGEGAAIVIKAVGGGGGRGMRVVRRLDEIDQAVERCRSEAQAAFGSPEVYAERLIERARHIEVQILGDTSGTVTHLGERECSVQRRHQKIVEVAPSPALTPELRDRIIEAAVRLAREAGYDNIGTIEFLVDADRPDEFVFIEANPRLQVEHTVTEEVTGVDLVKTQLHLAAGVTIADLGLDSVPTPRGYAIQARVNTETMAPDGSPRPTGGTLTAFEPPTGAGIRTETLGYTGYDTNPSFDSLLAKVIGYTPSGDFAEAAERTYRALSELRIDGVATNTGFLQSILRHDDFRAGRMTTRFIDDHAAELIATQEHPRLFFDEPAVARAGVRVDETDPLAVLVHGKTGPSPTADPPREAVRRPDGTVAIEARLQGTIVSVDVQAGDHVRHGQQLVVMEAMKMEHVVAADVGGIVRKVTVVPGDTIYGGQPVVFIEPSEQAAADAAPEEQVDLDEIRADLAEVVHRHQATLDENRPDAVNRRRETRQRTARENVDDLCDPGTFTEYGSLVLPTGMGRNLEEIMSRYPGDGMVCGLGTVNGELFGPPTSRCAVLAYDYTVLAGTQGGLNHRKTDRMLELAEEWRLPVVFFTEGGGGRAGGGGRRGGGGGSGGGASANPPAPATPAPPAPPAQPAGGAQSGQTAVLGGGGGGLDVPTFRSMGRLSGLVPLVGITSGFCFAGNAALLGCCDVIIATENSNIGMGGPAMVEGGGLGVYRPDEIGPMSVQVPNGVVDVAVRDEAEAVAVAKKYLSYFQGPVTEWDCPDQRTLRHAVPENRLRVYDIRKVVDTLADAGSVLELRAGFGHGMVTALIRIEGRPMGLIANNPEHLSGAIDADAADKASRFMQLCDAFDLPIVSLCDCPGIMVGPEVEKTAQVRHAARMFVTGSSLTVPVVTVVLRKAYGLGAMTMGAGRFKAPVVTVSWPTGEFGGMGLEGQVKLGYRDELASIEDPEARKRRYDQLVARMYQVGKALNSAVSFGIDDVIDPADTRHIVAGALQSVRMPERGPGKKRPAVDTW